MTGQNFDSDLPARTGNQAQPYDQSYSSGQDQLGMQGRPRMLRRRSSFAYGDGLDDEHHAERVGMTHSPQGAGLTFRTPSRQRLGSVMPQQPSPSFPPGGGPLSQRPASYIQPSALQQQPQAQYPSTGGAISGQPQYIVYPGPQPQQQQQFAQQQPQYMQQPQQPQYIQQQPQFVQQQPLQYTSTGGQGVQYMSTSGQQPLPYAAQPQQQPQFAMGGAGGYGGGIGTQLPYEPPRRQQPMYSGSQQPYLGDQGGMGFSGGRYPRSRSMSMSNPGYSSGYGY